MTRIFPSWLITVFDHIEIAGQRYRLDRLRLRQCLKASWNVSLPLSRTWQQKLALWRGGQPSTLLLLYGSPGFYSETICKSWKTRRAWLSRIGWQVPLASHPPPFLSAGRPGLIGALGQYLRTPTPQHRSLKIVKWTKRSENREADNLENEKRKSKSGCFHTFCYSTIARIFTARSSLSLVSSSLRQIHCFVEWMYALLGWKVYTNPQ